MLGREGVLHNLPRGSTYNIKSIYFFIHMLLRGSIPARENIRLILLAVSHGGAVCAVGSVSVFAYPPMRGAYETFPYEAL